MIKKFLILLSLGYLMAGCSLPGQKTTADPAQVATIVAMTLTSQPQPTSQVQNTPIPPTEPIIIISETPSSTFTTTPENTPTLTPTLTNTSVTTGFKESLGSPTWINTLDYGTAFGLDAAGYQDDYSRVYISNGSMILSSNSTYGYRGWRLTVKSPDNIYLEGQFESDSCSGNDLYGLVYRAPDYSSGEGYYLGLTCDGEYNVTKWTDTGTSTVLSSVFSPEIHAGPGQTNDLGIQMKGENFTIYINDKMISQFSDSSFTLGGHFGVFIAGQGGNLSIELDEIAYWSLQ